VKPLQRRGAAAEARPTSMTYDGTNGLEILEWSRDGDTSARFQYRPELPDEPARVRVQEPHQEWLIVPVGATIHLNRDGDLELELPDAEQSDETEETEA
jgi:hypothetical protein